MTDTDIIEGEFVEKDPEEAPEPKQVSAALKKAWENHTRGIQPPKPWHLVAIRLYARGIQKKEIARRLEKSYDAVNECIEKYPDEIDKAVRELSSPEEVFAPMLPKASKVYHDILEKEAEDAATMRVQQGIAGDVFDRAFGKPITRNINSNHHEIHISFSDTRDESSQENEELVKKQLRLDSSENGDLEAADEG